MVFTIDHEINDLAYHNQKLIYDLLFKSANETLKKFGQKYLKGQLGFTGVLHTWGQQIQPHIHLHFMVTGGALVRTAEGYEWNPSNPKFLFPVVELSASFRDRFCDGLLKLFEAGEMDLVGCCADADVPQMIERMRRRHWEVFIQKPPIVKNSPATPSLQEEGSESEAIFSDPMAVQEKVLDPMHLAEYLGRYIHQSAISNSRLLEMDEQNVHFRDYDNRDRDEQGRGKQKVMALAGVEFIRRILWHVLPKGYIRIRHYGLHASGCRTKLRIARFIFGLPLEIPSKPQLDLSEWLKSIGYDSPDRCPFCKSGTMRKYRTFGSLYGWRLMVLIIFGVLYPYIVSSAKGSQ